MSGEPTRRPQHASLALAWILLAGSFPESASSAQATSSRPHLELDAEIEGTLVGISVAGGRAERFAIDFVKRTPGAVTVSCESLDFDVFLEIEEPDGRAVASDDNAGVATNARVVLHGAENQDYSIFVRGASADAAGAFVVRAQLDAPELSGAELADARIAYWAEVAERAAETGNERRRLVGLLFGGRLCYQARRFDTAQRLLEEALPLADRLGDESARLTGLGLLGAASKRDDSKSARAYLDRARQGMLAAGGHELFEFVLDHRAKVLLELSEIEEARLGFEELLAAAERSSAVDAAVTARVGLANIAQRRGEWAAAERLYDTATTLASEAGGSHERYYSLFHGAVAAKNRGDLAAAASGLTAALEHANHEQRIGVLGELGNIDLLRGRLWDARSKYEEVYAYGLEFGSEAYEGGALLQLAVVHRMLGETPKAYEYVQAALARFQGQLDNRVLALVELGFVFSELGRPDDGVDSLLRARELARDVSPDREVETLHHLVQSYTRAGDLSRGLELQLEALETATENELHFLAALGRANLAYLHFSSGEVTPQDALRAAAEELQNMRDYAQPAVVITTLDTMARAAMQCGDLASANAALAEAESILQRPEIGHPGIEETSVWRARHAGLGELAQDLAALEWSLSEPATPEREHALRRAFQGAGSWKGRALLAGIAEHRHGAKTARGTELRQRRRAALEDLEEARVVLARSIASESEPAESGRLRTRLLGLRDEERQWAQRLRAEAPADAALDAPTGITVEDIRSSVLPEESALIEYVAGTQRMYAFVVTRELATLVDLGEREPLETTVARYAGVLGDRYSRVDSVADVGRQAYGALIEPVRALLTDVRSLIVVPCGVLATIPFGALVVDSDPGRARFLIDDYEIAYGPSAPVLAELQRLPAREEPSRVLVIADPIYPESRERLEGTREEAFAIARLLLDRGGLLEEHAAACMRLQGERSGELRTKPFDLYLGRSAVPARLRGDLSAYAVVHIAGHGSVDLDRPQGTGLALSFVDGGPGYLSVGDTLELALDSDLTVLSACDSARGKLRHGEGVQSLARAFIYAGSRSVIATLWRVPDQEAAETMKKFYEQYLGEGQRPSAALRAAKLAIRKRNLDRTWGERLDETTAPVSMAHPYWWAAYVYVGGLR